MIKLYWLSLVGMLLSGGLRVLGAENNNNFALLTLRCAAPRCGRMFPFRPDESLQGVTLCEVG